MSFTLLIQKINEGILIDWIKCTDCEDQTEEIDEDEYEEEDS